jgi:hypothetical protein
MHDDKIQSLSLQGIPQKLSIASWVRIPVALLVMGLIIWGMVFPSIALLRAIDGPDWFVEVSRPFVVFLAFGIGALAAGWVTRQITVSDAPWLHLSRETVRFRPGKRFRGRRRDTGPEVAVVNAGLRPVDRRAGAVVVVADREGHRIPIHPLYVLDTAKGPPAMRAVAGGGIVVRLEEGRLKAYRRIVTHQGGYTSHRDEAIELEPS